MKEQQNSSYVEPKTQATTSNVEEEEEEDEDDDDEEEATKSDTYDEIEAALLAAEKGTRCQWKVGDKCQAKWTEDGNYYDAIIEDINSTGEVSVVFEAYQNRSTTTLTDLRERAMRNDVFPSTKLVFKILKIAFDLYNNSFSLNLLFLDVKGQTTKNT